MAKSTPQNGTAEQLDLIGLTDDCKQLAFQRWTNSNSSIIISSVDDVFADSKEPFERVIANVANVSKPEFVRLASDGSALAWVDRLPTPSRENSAAFVLLLDSPQRLKIVVPGSTGSVHETPFPKFLGPNADWVLLSNSVAQKKAGYISPVLVAGRTDSKYSSMYTTVVRPRKCEFMQCLAISGNGRNCLLEISETSCGDRTGKVRPAAIPVRYLVFDFLEQRSAELRFVDDLRREGHVIVHTMSTSGSDVLVSTGRREGYETKTCTQVYEVYGSKPKGSGACLDTGFGKYTIIRAKFSADGHWLVLSLINFDPAGPGTYHVAITRSGD